MRIQGIIAAGLIGAIAATTGCQCSITFGPNNGKHGPTPGYSAAAYRSQWGVMGQPDGSPNLWAGQYPQGGPGYQNYGHNMVPSHMGYPANQHQMTPPPVDVEGTELPPPRAVPQ